MGVLASRLAGAVLGGAGPQPVSLVQVLWPGMQSGLSAGVSTPGSPGATGQDPSCWSALEEEKIHPNVCTLVLLAFLSVRKVLSVVLVMAHQCHISITLTIIEFESVPNKSCVASCSSNSDC